MNSISIVDIERLNEQLILNSKQNDEQKQKNYKRLFEQLVEKKAEVKIQRLHFRAGCVNLIDNLQEGLLFIGDVSSGDENDNIMKKRYKFDDFFADDGLSDSSDDEPLDAMIAKSKAERASASSSTTPDIYANGMETVVEAENKEEYEIDIKIPSIITGRVHKICLQSFEFGRMLVDHKVKQIKGKLLQNQQQRRDCLTNLKLKKLKNNEKTSTHQENLLQRDCQFSQLIEDVMNETCNEETTGNNNFGKY